MAKTFGLMDGMGVPTKVCEECAGTIQNSLENNKTMGDVLHVLREMIDKQFPDTEGFYIPRTSESQAFLNTLRETFRYRWIACYAVTGGNEGWWVHVDFVLDGYGERHQATIQSGGTCKTFNGREHAQRIAHRCAELLGA